jgi:hypothetical protein
VLFVLGGLGLVGCAGPGKYGYARRYVPLEAEEPFVEHAERVTYEQVRRDPLDYRGTMLGWFGVVTGLDEAPEGEGTMVHMTFRSHRKRHLCRTERESSCRVTVSEEQGGPFTARLRLRPDDRKGQSKVWVGSLLKVYGKPTGEFDERGGPILSTEWYRHWPRGNYVTTAAQGAMRR